MKFSRIVFSLLLIAIISFTTPVLHAQTQDRNLQLSSIVESLKKLLSTFQSHRSAQTATVSNFDSFLVAHYTFDDTTSDSKGTNHGTTNGGPTYVTGKIGRAMQFDGVDDYVTTDGTKSGQFMNGLNAISISYWVKPTSVASGYSLGRWGSGRQFSQNFFNSKVYFTWRYGGSFGGGTSLNNSTASRVSANTWQHVVAVYDNPTSKIYVNGVLEGTATGAGGALNTNVPDPLIFGKTGNSPTSYSGALDDVRIYSKALSSEEIADLYALGGDSVSDTGGNTNTNHDPVDTTTPTISNIASSNITTTGATISWTTNEVSDTQAVYGLTTNYGSQTPTNSSLVINHSITLSNLSPDTTYNYAVKSKDASGNLSTSANQTFKTAVTAGAQQTGLTSYYVSTTGSDTNPGTAAQPLRTIQKAADLARAGTTVYVQPGTYPEHVFTTNGGTSDSARVTFKAQGLVTMRGFQIYKPFVTVDGFDITGAAGDYGYINITPKTIVDPVTRVPVLWKGDNCKVLNNTIRDGDTNIKGILFYTSKGISADNCVVQGNKLSALKYVFITTSGRNHLFENNVSEWLNSRDYIHLFGHDHVFRHNIFYKGNSIEGTGNHPDWVQTFYDSCALSSGHLFEENLIEGLGPIVQLGQMNSGGTPSSDCPGLSNGIKDITFRRNVFANISHNFNLSVPNLTFDHNTFYRHAYGAGGFGFGASLMRGEASGALVTNNAFISVGKSTVTEGDGIRFTASTDSSTQKLAKAKLWYDSLKQNGYIDGYGVVTSKFNSLSNYTNLIVPSEFESYKQAIYDFIRQAPFGSDTVGFVSFQGAAMTLETVQGFISATYATPIYRAMQDNLYIGPNGNLLQAGRAITDISQFKMCGPNTDATTCSAIESLKTKTYGIFERLQDLDHKVRTTAISDYNFVAGPAIGGYAKKREDGCTEGTFTGQRFCELHREGRNGGNPLFQNSATILTTSDILGPDGKMFTLDDGLKPLTNSPLCGKDSSGGDIGAYSCDLSKVFSSGNSGNVGINPNNTNYIPPPTSPSDTTPPFISITQPQGPVSGTAVPLTITATDNVGVVGVQIKVNGINLPPELTSPFTSTWDTTPLADGTYTLTAVARDASGNTKTSNPVIFIVRNSIPGTPDLPQQAVDNPGTEERSSGGGGGGGRSSKKVGKLTPTSTTPDFSKMTKDQAISWIKAKLIELITELNVRLKAEGKPLMVVPNFPSTQPLTPSASHIFNTDLYLNINHPDVWHLQRFLNTHGYPVGTNVGSYGKEVNTFGPVTKATLQKFQQANGIPATGYFGPETRARVNALNR